MLEDITNKTIADISASYVPNEGETYMCPAQLEYFRCKLLAWREELSAESQNALEYLQTESLNEPDISDRASAELDTALELRTKDRGRKLIEKIDVALMKISSGGYGYCEDTGEEIGIKRLVARPIATLCLEAQEQHERFEKTHNDVI